MIFRCPPWAGTGRGGSLPASPGLLARAGPTVSATLSPTAVSSFTSFQVPGPHPAAPTLQPRKLPSWGSGAESFGNLSLMSSVIKVLIRQVGQPRRVPNRRGECGGEFRWPITSALGLVHFHCRRWVWMPLINGMSPSCFSRFLPLPVKTALSGRPRSGSPSAGRPTYPPPC